MMTDRGGSWFSDRGYLVGMSARYRRDFALRPLDLGVRWRR